MRLILIITFIFIFCGCTKKIYVPQHTSKAEYINNFIRDSVYIHDSVFVEKRIGDGTIRVDTMFIEKFRYIYRDKLINDTVIIRDSISYPVYVEVEKKVHRKVPKIYKLSLLISILSIFALGWKMFR